MPTAYLHEKPVKVTGEHRSGNEAGQDRRAFVAITIFGSDSTFSEGEMGDIERKVMDSREKAEISWLWVANCSSKGERRDPCPIGDLGVTVDDDGYTASFSLPKGTMPPAS